MTKQSMKTLEEIGEAIKYLRAASLILHKIHYTDIQLLAAFNRGIKTINVEKAFGEK